MPRLDPPPWLSRLVPGWEPTLAYQLMPEVTTWRLTHPDGRVRFAKISACRGYPTLAGEAERMVWAAAYLPVPTVVAIEDVDGSTVLITEGLRGHDATDPRWSGDQPGLVRIFGEGLAAFHRAVGEEWCPFRFEVGVALEHVRRRAEAGLLDPAHQFHPEFRHLTVASAVALLEAVAPDVEDLVVCHGDYCPPNVLVADGRVTGYVDLGELGVADRWWDITIGAWSRDGTSGPSTSRSSTRAMGSNPIPIESRSTVSYGSASRNHRAGGPVRTRHRTWARSVDR